MCRRIRISGSARVKEDKTPLALFERRRGDKYRLLVILGKALPHKLRGGRVHGISFTM